MRVAVPVPTVEKPLTVVDYIATMAQCDGIQSLTQYALDCPPHILEDDRFAAAFGERLQELRVR